LQEPQTEVVVRNGLVARRGLLTRKTEEAPRGDVGIVDNGREFSGDHLIADAEWATDASRHESIKGVRTPPKAAPFVAYPESAPSLLSTVSSRRRLGFLCVIWQSPIDIIALLVMQTEIDGETDSHPDDIPRHVS
jgi:hypothetical protein